MKKGVKNLTAIVALGSAVLGTTLLSGCVTTGALQTGVQTGILGALVDRDDPGEGAAIGFISGLLLHELTQEQQQTYRKYCPKDGRYFPENTRYCPRDGTELQYVE